MHLPSSQAERQKPVKLAEGVRWVEFTLESQGSRRPQSRATEPQAALSAHADRGGAGRRRLGALAKSSVGPDLRRPAQLGRVPTCLCAGFTRRSTAPAPLRPLPCVVTDANRPSRREAAVGRKRAHRREGQLKRAQRVASQGPRTRPDGVPPIRASTHARSRLWVLLPRPPNLFFFSPAPSLHSLG